MNCIYQLQKKFGLENPQLDVQEVRDPDLDPSIVGKQIAAATLKILGSKDIDQLRKNVRKTG